jgi:hypothetical protein
MHSSRLLGRMTSSMMSSCSEAPRLHGNKWCKPRHAQQQQQAAREDDEQHGIELF